MRVTAHEFDGEFADLVQQERGITREVVEMIALCVKRRFFADLGYRSVQGWLIGRHGYPKSCAYRRIEAARLVTSVPSAIERLEAGKVNLSTLATLQSAIRREEERTSSKIDGAKREELFAKIEDMTEEQTERLVATEFPEIIKDKVESVKPVSASETRMTVIFTDEQMALIERVREISAHSNFGASWSELFVVLAEEYLERHDPVRKAERACKRAQTKFEKQTARETREAINAKGSAAEPFAPLPAHVRNAIILRDDARCSFVDPITRTKCDSRHQLEVDHIIPRALGGTNDPENLRVLCRTHNGLVANRKFGESFMEKRIRAARAEH